MSSNILDLLSDALPLDAGSGSLPAPVEISPTAIDLDSWAKRRGLDVLKISEGLQKAYDLPGPESQNFSAFTAYEEASREVADFHAAAFEMTPQLVPRCEDERRREYLQAFMESEEYQSLHQETQLDEEASELATVALAANYLEMCEQPEPDNPADRHLQSLRASRKAHNDAQDNVSVLRDAQRGLGLGKGEGSQISASDLQELFKRVRSSDMIRRICELAGRYRRFAQAQQRTKTQHGQDDMVGVEADNDLGRILPHELLALDDPDFCYDAMRRFLERGLMCREYQGLETKAKGPIVVVVDESGSMGGEPIANAKAIALALAWIARHQKRWCFLAGFSSGEGYSPSHQPPGKPEPSSLLSWLEHFYGGGTTCDVPLSVIPRDWKSIGAPTGKTDMILITDAILDVPDKIKESFLAWKQAESCRLITLVIGEKEAGGLKGVSDQLHFLDMLSLDEEGVQKALSI